MINKKPLVIVLLLVMLVLVIYLKAPHSTFPDLDISIQLNLKISSQNEQGT